MTDSMYHFIYKTTCSVTGRFYMGMHSTFDLDDGYLGSGKILGQSINLHGIECHTREIIQFCESREELVVLEIFWINQDLLNNPKCMNLALGGHGGATIPSWNDMPKEWQEIHRARMQEQGRKMAEQWATTFSAEERISIARKAGLKGGRSTANIPGHLQTIGFKTETAGTAGLVGAHNRWHKNKGMTNPSCSLCISEEDL